VDCIGPVTGELGRESVVVLETDQSVSPVSQRRRGIIQCVSFIAVSNSTAVTGCAVRCRHSLGGGGGRSCRTYV
jgi:hypothetical protein